MKKFLKALLITISSLILLYGVFVGIDCVRLYNVDESEKPLITIKERRTEDSYKYEGLGYTVTYKYDSEKPNISEEGAQNAYPGSYIYSAEFKLFDNILLWAWIA